MRGATDSTDGQVGVLELGRERHRRVGRRDEGGRRVEQLEAIARDEREDVARDAARARRLLEDEQARRLAERLEHRVASSGHTVRRSTTSTSSPSVARERERRPRPRT